MSSENASPPSERHSVRLHRPASRKRRYLVATLLLLLAMGAGAIVGAGGAIMYMQKKRPRPPRPHEVGNSIIREMVDSLDLAEVETASLRTLVDKHMEAIDGIRKKSWDDIRSQFDAMQDEVVDLVGPDRYAKWESERDRRLGVRKNLNEGKKNPRAYDPHRWRERRPGPGPGPGMGPGPGKGPGMHHD